MHTNACIFVGYAIFIVRWGVYHNRPDELRLFAALSQQGIFSSTRSILVDIGHITVQNDKCGAPCRCYTISESADGIHWCA